MNKIKTWLYAYWLHLSVVVFAFVIRVWNINSPHGFQMDEEYYLPDAAALLMKGYEAQFDNPENFSNSSPSLDYDSTHPPLGKWLIALGMLLFGKDNGLGWRFGSVIAGTLIVAVAMWVAYLLFKNKWVALLTGGLLAVSSLNIALSRVSHIDIFLTLFGLLAVVAVLKDLQSDSTRVFLRPWVIMAGVFIGAATACKWSGAYFGLALVIYWTVSSIYRNCGSKMSGKTSKVKALLIGIIVMPIIAVFTYLITWTGWLLNYALVKTEGNFLLSFQMLITEHLETYKRAVDLSYVHSFNSNATEWFLATRPTLLYSEYGIPCNTGECSQIVSSAPNLIVWWLSMLAVIVLVIGLFAKRYPTVLWVLPVAVAGFWFPWFQYHDRTIFEFYTVAFEPYLCIVLAFMIWRYVNFRKLNYLWIFILGLIATLAVIVSFSFYPNAIGLIQGSDAWGIKILDQWTFFTEETGLHNKTQSEIITQIK